MTRIAPFAAALCLALCVVSPSQASQMKGMDMKPAAVKTGSGVGVIKSVDVKTGMVTIQHEPIPAVGWPAMTMAFKATNPTVMKDAKTGQKVAFGVRITGSKAEVTSISPSQ